MSSAHETAYPLLQSEFTDKELKEIYTPTPAEYALVISIRKPAPRLGFLLHLKLFQRLGYFTRLDTVPIEIIQYIKKHSRILKAPNKQQLKEYDRSGTKTRHQKIIRKHLGVNVLTEKDRVWLKDIAYSAAETKEALPDIINIMLEELVHHCFELPGFNVIQRIAMDSRNQVNKSCYQAVASSQSSSAKKRINELLSKRSSDSYSDWNMIKREPKIPTNKEVRNYLQHVHWLQELGKTMPDVDLPVVKLKQFTLEARALDATEMADLKPNKRYTLAVLLIRSQHSKALDDVAEMFIRLVRKIESSAQAQLESHLLSHQKHVDKLILRFKEMLTAYQKEGTLKERFSAIEATVAGEAEQLIDQCDEHIAYAGNNYLPFMLQPYKFNRALLFNCLKILNLQSSSSDKTTDNLLSLLKSLQNSHKEYLKPKDILPLTDVTFDTKWMPEKWRKLVLIKQEGSRNVDSYHRKYLELSILSLIKNELSSADLFIPYSDQYDDYREQLVDDETFQCELETYGDLVDLPVIDPNVFSKHLKTQLTDVSREVDKSFPNNVHADIKDGCLILSKKKRVVPSGDLQIIDEKITRSLATTNIVDVLTVTEKWLNLHKFFSPLSGNERRIDNAEKRFITTLFCYGCNLGPSQTEKSIKDFTRRQVAWLNLKHASEERLDMAIKKVINAYNKFDLPKYWGTGKHASADGTKWDLYEQNMLSEYHIRYGGYGGIGYYHVSDTYIALFSHFIPCGVYEAVYILDGLMSNESDIQPDTLHGDTQAQSYPVFGLSYLLGINLMPRIRNIKKLTLFRPDKRYKYQNIDELFSGNINFKLIETHLHDMLKIAISIKLGKITASTILRRLGTYNRKNKLYFAFCELGKVIRTIFLLRYIDKVELRQTIHSATNKSEEFNNFIKWLFFGGEGIIAENIRHEQRKIVKYNQLVANMLILYNVEEMTKVLKEFTSKGVELTPEILAGLSPYRTAHVNRFGDYTLNINRKVEPLDYSLKIL